MSLSIGIIGMPNAGKSTLFNALLKKQIAQVAEYPYTTIEPNVGVVEVPDERLGKITEVLKIPKRVPAAIRFIDIAGLIKGAHQGEGLGNQFLAHIREVDAILHVVRAFQNPKVTHVHGKIDPKEDIEIVNLEMELAGIKKPTIYVLNVAESDLKKDFDLSFDYLKICAKLEAELGELEENERHQYLRELEVKESGLDKVIKEAYKLLGLITFFTVAGGKMAQAWPLRRGQTALAASSLVHTDFARGFIAAEIIAWDRLIEAGSRPEGRGSLASLPASRLGGRSGPGAAWLAAREKGLIKTAGKNEVVEDGQVIEFKFSL